MHRRFEVSITLNWHVEITRCESFRNEPESIHHVFISCPFNYNILKNVLSSPLPQKRLHSQKLSLLLLAHTKLIACVDKNKEMDLYGPVEKL